MDFFGRSELARIFDLGFENCVIIYNVFILKPLLIVVELYFGKTLQFHRACVFFSAGCLQTKRNDILCPKDGVKRVKVNDQWTFCGFWLSGSQPPSFIG